MMEASSLFVVKAIMRDTQRGALPGGKDGASCELQKNPTVQSNPGFLSREWIYS
jgi:hypothetical protein